MYKAISFIGPPASGKSTQARTLVDKMGMTRLSTGDLIRENEKDLSGKYVSDVLIESLIKEELNLADENNFYVLDGFPRTYNQIEMTDKYFDLQRVFYINNLKQFDLLDRMNDRGREEDKCRRIADYILYSSCVSEFYEMCRPEIVTRLDGRLNEADQLSVVLHQLSKLK